VTDAPQEATGRWGNGWIVLEGSPHQLIPYGSETIDGVDVFSTPCHLCDAAPGARHKRGCSMGMWHRRPQRCRDCGTEIGELHALTCGIERCPCCGGQSVSCSCNGSEDAPDVEVEDEDSDDD
jgi:hypothetical protein